MYCVVFESRKPYWSVVHAPPSTMSHPTTRLLSSVTVAVPDVSVQLVVVPHIAIADRVAL
jgi:hypothetical protein